MTGAALVTGATGIVGSHLVRSLLDAGSRVCVLVRDADPRSQLIQDGTIDRCAVVNGSLEDYASVERAIVEHEIDTVFHLGAQTIVGAALRAPLATFESNIRGSWNLLEAARRSDGTVERVVIASSDKAYGESDVLPYREEMPMQGRHPYDVSKSCTDLLASTYHHTYGLPVSIARCGNIYGPGDLNWSRIVPGTIRSVLRGERPVIRSNGLYKRDYIFVHDVVSAYMLLADQMKATRGKAYNFGPGQPMTVLEVVEAILEQVGRTDLRPIIQDAARAEIRDQWLDCSRARNELGWSQRYDFASGLAETLPWYRALLGGR